MIPLHQIDVLPELLDLVQRANLIQSESRSRFLYELLCYSSVLAFFDCAVTSKEELIAEAKPEFVRRKIELPDSAAVGRRR